MLLDEPELIRDIVAAVRRAVPAHLPVSAKIRLGVRDGTKAVECAQAVEDGGANELVVHARTKAQGYRPPVYWEQISDSRSAVALSLVANGDIWSVQDAWRCRQITGCDDLMVGRGMVRDPGLARSIQASSEPDGRDHPLNWAELFPLLGEFWRQVSGRVESRHRAGRLKQWLSSLRSRYPEAQAAFDELRLVQDPVRIGEWLSGGHRALAVQPMS